MKPNEITSHQQYIALTEKYGKHKIFTNDFLQAEAPALIAKHRLYESHTEANLFLFVKQAIGMRLYYYVSNETEPADLSDNHNILCDIIYRINAGMPSREIDYLKRSDLSLKSAFDLYCLLSRDYTPAEITPSTNAGDARSLEEARQAVELFNSMFDPLTGDYISATEAKELVEDGRIFIMRSSEGEFIGAVHFNTGQGTLFINHLAIRPDKAGQGYGKELLYHFLESKIDKERKRIMVWVRRDNLAAVGLYTSIGYKLMNKATLSYIKL